MNISKNLWLAIADVFLSDEPPDGLQSDKRTLRDYYIFFSGIAVGYLLYVLPPLALNTQAVPFHALIARILCIIGVAMMIASTINFSVSYYKFSLTKFKSSHDHLTIMIGFYFLVMIMFAVFYRSIYDISPISFAYQNAPYVTKQTAQYIGVAKGAKTNLDFFIYSASNMTMSNYWKIQSRSYVVSVANFLQVLYSLFILILCISTYVTHIKAQKLSK